MKKLFEKHFEGTWTVIFLICFFFIMIPFPFFYSETYIHTGSERTAGTVQRVWGMIFPE